MTHTEGLYIALISVHGLIRGGDLELGRDADTGGQIRYVIELARALSACPDVSRVDLFTRLVLDPYTSDDYARSQEELAPGAYIIRVPCGPKRYLRKEVLWPHLDSFADQALQHIRLVKRVPDVIHSHYADAGWVGAHLAGLLGVPLVFTGHSLGRVKRQRLLDKGIGPDAIERHYSITQRIDAEETTLDTAALVVASTRQEVEQQYSLYDNYSPRRMTVIPPGVDLRRFRRPNRSWKEPPIKTEVRRFLRDVRKPMILAISRPDSRKNLSTLVRAFGQNERLRELANLVIVAGARDDIRSAEREPRSVLTGLLLEIDRWDLYGSVAYPKAHQPNDIPDLYRLAAQTKGVFVNPALTEPFGITLLEAAASGLPVLATEDGGPRDIIAQCKNGLLIDPLDAERMSNALLEAITDRKRWRKWSVNGARRAPQYFSWPSHVKRYLGELNRILRIVRESRKPEVIRRVKSRLPISDRLLVCDIDGTLTGDEQALKDLLRLLSDAQVNVGQGVATGRHIRSAIKELMHWGVPMPDLLITSVGTQIHYGPKPVEDTSWARHIGYRWDPEGVRGAMSDFSGLKLQPKDAQSRHKISYFIDTEEAPSIRHIRSHLRKRGLHCYLVYSHGVFLDVLPIRASKGGALRYVAYKWGIPLERILVAGDSGNDIEMMLGETLGVVVGNCSPEVERLRGLEKTYFAESHHASGVLEGIKHYDFLRPDLSEGDAK
ncbi:MAG: HAD-IIB family hydrolase [Candidatus Coatesbacteria bacterium]|nr:HAD-IIB family hydrolase [Candidatus Coatesbacteria bacterium]